jgi:hypothetical protein
MAAKKQHESESASTPIVASDWFRQFLKHLELDVADSGQQLHPDATIFECGLVAIESVKRVLLDSGLDEEQIMAIFGHSVSNEGKERSGVQWTAELNQRRFELIDLAIQRTLSVPEELELASLTHIMREQVDSEANLPFEAARKLHRYLIENGDMIKGSEN